MPTTKQSKRGGERAGAGRKHADPQLKKERAYIMLPKWIMEKLKKLDEGRNEAAEKALCQFYGWKQPKTGRGEN